MANDCLNILNALDIDKAHILGTSMGGMIAQLVAFITQIDVKALFL